MGSNEQGIIITCKGLWSPSTTGDYDKLLIEIKELLSEVVCLEEVKVAPANNESQTA